MAAPLRLLIVEDSEDDTELILRDLRQAGYDQLTHLRVDTLEALAGALESQTWDIVISDHTMPNFDSFAALRLIRERDLDLPFIVLSGTIGEETAIALLKAGANDYIMKDRPEDLPQQSSASLARWWCAGSGVWQGKTCSKARKDTAT